MVQILECDGCGKQQTTNLTNGTIIYYKLIAHNSEVGDIKVWDADLCSLCAKKVGQHPLKWPKTDTVIDEYK
jgi:hypothetical protein